MQCSWYSSGRSNPHRTRRMPRLQYAFPPGGLQPQNPTPERALTPGPFPVPQERGDQRHALERPGAAEVALTHMFRPPVNSRGRRRAAVPPCPQRHYAHQALLHYRQCHEIDRQYNVVADIRHKRHARNLEVVITPFDRCRSCAYQSLSRLGAH